MMRAMQIAEEATPASAELRRGKWPQEWDDAARLDWLSSLYSDREWNVIFRHSVSNKQTIRETIDEATHNATLE